MKARDAVLTAALLTSKIQSFIAFCVVIWCFVMTLEACKIHEPSYKLVMAGEPKIDLVSSVVYVPETPGGNPANAWGIFGRDRRLITSSGYFRGPGPHLPQQNYTTTIDYDQVSENAPDQSYVYGGRVDSHFGHFLVGCLPRYWKQSEFSSQKRKIVIHSHHSIGTLFDHKHIARIFGAIGLTADNFVRFTEPTRIAQLSIPWPSFEEGHLAYPAFAQLCHRIGASLMGPAPALTDSRPVYFTKEHLTAGNSRLVNEGEFTKILTLNGVDVIAPEQMDLAEQIKLFASRPLISGSFGSVFHTSIFHPRCKLLMLNWGDTMYRNFTLIDAINQNDTHYVFPNHEIDFCGDIAGFGANWRLSDPVGAAEQFLRVMEVFSSGGNVDGSAVRNLAYQKPTSQSSYAEEQSSADPKQSRAVDGRLTAGVAFHTAHETGAWWQVDLEQIAYITKIVIFNVVGPPIITERSSKLRLLVSGDGEEWSEVFRRVDDEPFGGVDGQPLVWDAGMKIVCRFVRIQLLEAQFLHLDQVQVFGKALSTQPVVMPSPGTRKRWWGFLPSSRQRRR